MTQHDNVGQPRQETDEWENALHQFVTSRPPRLTGVALATLLRRITPAEQHGLLDDITRAWQQPDDELRWQVFHQAEKVGFTTPAGALALALFWAYGSMSPAGIDPVMPEPHLCPDMLHCVLVMCASALAELPADGARLLLAEIA